MAFLLSVLAFFWVLYLAAVQRFNKTWLYRAPMFALVLSVLAIIATYIDQSPCSSMNTLREMPREVRWIPVFLEAAFVAFPLALTIWVRKKEKAYGT